MELTLNQTQITFVFFDGLDVNKFVRPQSATYSQDGGTTVTSGVKMEGMKTSLFLELPNSDSDSISGRETRNHF